MAPGKRTDSHYNLPSWASSLEPSLAGPSFEGDMAVERMAEASSEHNFGTGMERHRASYRAYMVTDTDTVGGCNSSGGMWMILFG